MLIHASRTRSSVGRSCEPTGALIFRPRHRPATIRTLRCYQRAAVRHRKTVSPIGRLSAHRAPLSCLSARADIRYAGLEVTLAAVLVALQSERDVDFASGLKLRGAVSETPAQRVKRAGTGIEDHLHSVLADEPGIRGECDVTREEHRRGIPNPERLEMAEQRFQALVHAIDADLEIDSNLGNEILGSQQGPRDFVE